MNFINVKLKTLLVCLVLSFVSLSASAKDIFYVKSGGTGDGSSWSKAMGNIQQAVDSAAKSRADVWVAKGVYYGDSTSAAVVNLSPGVSLYGGFSGNESSLSDRDLEMNVTVIDGELNKKCILQESGFDDSLAVIVDGFSLEKGRAGFWDDGGCATVAKNVTFINCVIKNNSGSFNTAFVVRNSVIKKCKFLDNSANIISASYCVVDSCIFNAPTSREIGIATLEQSKLTNCLFYDNAASYGLINATKNSLVSNCEIYRNKTLYDPLVNLNNSSMVNCLIYENVADRSNTIVMVRNSSSFSNSTVANNTTTSISTITGTIANDSYSSVVSNSIIFGNKMSNELKPQINKLDFMKVRYCASDEEVDGDNCIKLAKANSGSDSTQNYVCFVNAVAGDYRLHATSSCIDKGLDSLCTQNIDVYGKARIYGKSIDLGAIEFDGEYVPMLDYNQTVCYNGNSIEATFDSTISKIDWQIVDKGNVSGFTKTSGSGVSIPSMQLKTTKKDIDILSLKVTPYDADGVAGVPFSYNYYVYPDLSKQTISFNYPKNAYEVNDKSSDLTISWKNISIPVVIEHSDLFVWKSSQEMPEKPIISLVKGNSKYISNLDNHTTYKYMVKIVTTCDTIYSDVDSFRIDIPEHLTIVGSKVCELGTKLNETTSITRYVKGFELKDSLSYFISGTDSSDFTVKLSDKWNPLTGGNFDVYFTPTDSDKPLSKATLTFTSGKYSDKIDLSGILANHHVFDITIEKEEYKAGDTIAIKGHITDAYGNPMEAKRVKIYMIKNGLEIKSFDLVSDAKGEVEAKYISYTYESGVYSVGMCLNGESSKATFTEFNIPGISCVVDNTNWLVQKGDTILGSVTIKNNSNIAVHNLKIKTLTLANGCKVEFDTIGVLNGLESKQIKYTVAGMILTEGNTYLSSSFRVETNEGLSSDFSTYFYCEMPYGQIKVLPSNIKEYVSKQKPKYVELLLCNQGIGETGKVSVSLPDNFKGISMPNGTEIESIKPGDTVRATLKLAYYDGAKLNTPVNGTIVINSKNGKSTSVKFTMEYTSSSVGDVVVDVVDEYFYNSSAKNHLEGAKVEIKNAFNSQVVASAVTDKSGKVHFDSIPEGDYLLTVNADKHSNYKETISVQAGQTLNKFVFTSYEAVKYTWNVERVEIEDKYEMTLNTEFETHVPAPVVTVEVPGGIPGRNDFNPGDKKIVYMVITNHGLIAAKDVRVVTPSMKYFKFTPDVDHIDSLPANNSVVVPMVIERVDVKDSSSSTPNDGNGGNSGNGNVGNENGGNSGNGNGDNTNGDKENNRPGYTGEGDGFIKPPYVIPGGGSSGLNMPSYYPGGGNQGNLPGGGQPGSSLGDDDDCPKIIIIYSYYCGELLFKFSFLNLWPCPKSSINVDVNIPGLIWNYNIYSISVKECDSCDVRPDALINCFLDLVGLIPGIGDVVGAYGTVSGAVSSASNIRTIVNKKSDDRDVASSVYSISTYLASFAPILSKIPFGCLDLLCQYFSCENNGKFAEDCGQYLYDAGTNFWDDKLRSTGDTVNFYKYASPYLLAWHDRVEYTAFQIYRSKFIAECIGADDNMMSKKGLVDYLDVAWNSIANLQQIDIDKIKSIPVSDLSLTDMISISERWNRTIEAWNHGIHSSNDDYPNIAEYSVWRENLDKIINFYHYVVFRGFEYIPDMLDFINGEMAKSNNNKKSVCASVKLQMSQTMSMTREAFDGTLTVYNGQESLDMDSFRVVLDIRDENGNPANDLFQINTQSLSGISSIDGTESIESGDEATAVFRFIPERGAAPKSPVNYSFGGKIIYIEAGDTITINIEPVTLTVNPSPDLQIDYFMQRNVLGDDALTLDRVEPTVPAALGVIINNQGYGVAKNVKLESAKPEIVDNEKGLLIDFDFIGASLNGKDCNLGYENINFGNIDAQSAKTGLWWLTSSLLGHFTKYEANVVHANSYGNADLSLVNGVAIHELIKTVDAYGDKEDGVVDFLVNDDNDSAETPDAIYYSNGGKDTVKVAKSAKINKTSVTSSDTIVTLSVTPSDSGWTYAQVADPGNNNYDIKKVVRTKDNVEIPLSNVWTTFVTLPDGSEPIYENRLHFLDFMSTLGEQDYKIYYSIRKNILNVTEISGVPQNETTVTSPVDSVIVKFNCGIQKQSFDYNDIELYCQAGDNLSDSTITIKQIDELTYMVNISAKTKTSGFYKLEVNVDNIYDKNGYSGVFGKNAAWTQFIQNEEDDDDDENENGEITPITDLNNDEIVIYSRQNGLYVIAQQSGSLDIYDIVSRLIVKDAKYGLGISHVATLPSGVYIVNGKKLIIK